MTSEPTSTAAPEKPANLNKPMRAFVKRNGKKLVRKIAAFQSKQSKVPDTPKIDNSFHLTNTASRRVRIGRPLSYTDLGNFLKQTQSSRRARRSSLRTCQFRKTMRNAVSVLTRRLPHGSRAKSSFLTIHLSMKSGMTRTKNE